MKKIGFTTDMLKDTTVLFSPVTTPQCYGGMAANISLNADQMHNVLDELYLNISDFPEMTDKQALKDITVTAEVYPSLNNYRAGLCRAYAYIPSYSQQPVPLQLCTADQMDLFNVFTEYTHCTTLQEFSLLVDRKTKNIVFGHKYDINENTQITVNNVKIYGYYINTSVSFDKETQNILLARTGLLDKCGYFAEEAVMINKWLQEHEKTVYFELRDSLLTSEDVKIAAVISDNQGKVAEFSNNLNHSEYDCIRQAAEKFLREHGEESYDDIMNRCAALEAKARETPKEPIIVDEILSILESWVDSVTVKKDPKNDDITLISLGITGEEGHTYEFEPLKFNRYPIEVCDFHKELNNLLDNISSDDMAVEIYENKKDDKILRQIIDECEKMYEGLENIEEEIDTCLPENHLLFLNFEIKNIGEGRIDRLEDQLEEIEKDIVAFPLDLYDDSLRFLYEQSYFRCENDLPQRYEDYDKELEICFILDVKEKEQGLAIREKGSKEPLSVYTVLSDCEIDRIFDTVWEFNDKTGRCLGLEAKEIFNAKNKSLNKTSKEHDM